MTPKVKKYSLERIVERFEFAVGGTGISVYSNQDTNRVDILYWVGEGKKQYKTDIAYINPDLTTNFHEGFGIPDGDKGDKPYSVIQETTPDQQARYAASLFVRYAILLSLSTFP
jgi:hypothetical protein